jgi:hypothetical protein
MATHSTIAKENNDGTVTQVYCHWDGYPTGVGHTLLNHYCNADKLSLLLSHGGISSLGDDIGEQHSFTNPYKYSTPEHSEWANDPKNSTTFYGRDCHEDVDINTFGTLEHYLVDCQREEFDYILKTDGKWYLLFGSEFEELETIIEEYGTK